MITIEQINQWQDIVRTYNNQPIPYTDLVAKCAKSGLENVMIFLNNEHYISKMKDGNVFVNWSKNKFYSDKTIVALKAELTGSSREPTLEERVTILEEQMKQLLEGKV